MIERCTIVIEMKDAEWGGEDIVKNAWPYLTPWFTRRHGVERGKITLNGDTEVSWEYETEYDAQESYPDTDLPF